MHTDRRTDPPIQPSPTSDRWFESGPDCIETEFERAVLIARVGMAISGHRTVSMFMRYNITSGADKVEALKRTAEHLASKPKGEEHRGQVSEMPQREAAHS
jgi:hypothetical protein